MTGRKHHLQTVSNSSLAAFGRCPREYKYAYVDRVRLRERSEALEFGTLLHKALAAWWASPPSSRLGSALSEIDGEPYAVATARALMIGYDVAYYGIYMPSEVEHWFTMQRNGYAMVGAIDAISTDSNGVVHLVEHKTTSNAISPGSDYWRAIDALDPQVSTYMAAARANNYNARDMIYDVIRKPTIRPDRATPVGERKYTIPSKANPVPRLYASQREQDETPGEWCERLMLDISTRPEWYYQRRTIVRLEADEMEHERDIDGMVAMIMLCSKGEMWPRNTNSCIRYGRTCDYFDVCSGTCGLNDERFRQC
jgi:hypothetical protein